VKRADPPVLALRAGDAAKALGISRDSFDRFVRDELRWTRIGTMRLVSIVELQKYLDRHAVDLLARDWEQR